MADMIARIRANLHSTPRLLPGFNIGGIKLTSQLTEVVSEEA